TGASTPSSAAAASERGKGLEAAEFEAGVPPVELAADAAPGERAAGEAVGGLAPVIRPKVPPLSLSLAIRAGAP
ncbi:hypothetical protein DW087_10125, partial [Olsenella sp. AM04-33]